MGQEGFQSTAVFLSKVGIFHINQDTQQTVAFCTELQYTTSNVHQYNMNGRDIEISIPDHIHFRDLQRRLVHEQVEETSVDPRLGDRAKLDTWIFTPVVDGRCQKGNLNLRHSMVDLSSEKPCYHFLHSLVGCERR